MAHADLVKDVLTSSGTGSTVTLSGTPTAPYRTLAALGAPGSGLTFDYAIKDATQFEIGTATLGATANTFTRGPLFSSNSNAAVNFSAGAEFIVTVNATTLAAFLTAAGVATLTNKRITKRVSTITTPATAGVPIVNTDAYDVTRITALAADITNWATNWTGTPDHGDEHTIEITSAAIRNVGGNWAGKAESSTIVLPSATVANQMLTISLMYNSTTSKWRCIGVA